MGARQQGFPNLHQSQHALPPAAVHRADSFARITAIGHHLQRPHPGSPPLRLQNRLLQPSAIAGLKQSLPELCGLRRSSHAHPRGRLDLASFCAGAGGSAYAGGILRLFSIDRSHDACQRAGRNKGMDQPQSSPQPSRLRFHHRSTGSIFHHRNSHAQKSGSGQCTDELHNSGGGDGKIEQNAKDICVSLRGFE